jgi:DNA-binding transcriptional ArsR family regulator
LRSAGRLVVLLIALVPGALAQADLPTLALPTLDLPPVELPAPEEPLPEVPPVTVSLPVDIGVLGAPDLLHILDASPPPAPPLAPRPFAEDAAPPAPAGGEQLGLAYVPSPDPDPGPDPGVATLMATTPEALAAAPAMVHVAVGITAAFVALARLFSRFGRKDVLESEPRERIHDLLVAGPGATVSDLAAATGLSRGAVAHHCRMLERHGLLTSRLDGASLRLFVAGGPRLPDEAPPPTPAGRRVLDLLREKGPLTQAEVAAHLGVTPQAVSYHLLRLRRDARVEAQREDGERRWAVAGADEAK